MKSTNFNKISNENNNQTNETNFEEVLMQTIDGRDKIEKIVSD